MNTTKLRVQSKSAASQRRRRARLRNRGLCIDCAKKPAQPQDGRCTDCYQRKLSTGNQAAVARRAARRAAKAAAAEAAKE